jgi:hypothetical protein
MSFGLKVIKGMDMIPNLSFLKKYGKKTKKKNPMSILLGGCPMLLSLLLQNYHKNFK